MDGSNVVREFIFECTTKFLNIPLRFLEFDFVKFWFNPLYDIDCNSIFLFISFAPLSPSFLPF